MVREHYFNKRRIIMPKVYLSPSLQEYNPYVDGGNEEYYMNLVADAIEPYLLASGIEFDRNSPEMTLSQAIKDSNNSANDLHLAVMLHRRARQADIPVLTYIIIRQALTEKGSLKSYNEIMKRSIRILMM